MSFLHHAVGLAGLHYWLRLTGTPLLVLICVLAVALPAAAVFSWTRFRTLRVSRTIAALVASQLMVTLAIGLMINRSQNFFTSWSDLFGTAAPAAHQVKVAPGSLDSRVATHEAGAKAGQGVVVEITLHGTRSHITEPAWVYLPPQYNKAGWKQRRFPVIEALDGYPGDPQRWLNSLRLRQVMDAEIDSGRMQPTIVVLPTQTTGTGHDSECINQVGGPQWATYLTTDLRQAIEKDFRAIANRDGWGLTGYSTGGFCTNNLALQHDYGYAATGSMSGYFVPYIDSSTGNLFAGSVAAREANDPTWQVEHVKNLPSISMYAACAAPDPDPCKEGRAFALAARGTPIQFTQMELPSGGHNFTTWRAVEAPVLDFLSDHLVGPAAPASVPDKHIPTVIPHKKKHTRNPVLRAGGTSPTPSGTRGTTAGGANAPATR